MRFGFIIFKLESKNIISDENGLVYSAPTNVNPSATQTFLPRAQERISLRWLEFYQSSDGFL